MSEKLFAKSSKPVKGVKAAVQLASPKKDISSTMPKLGPLLPPTLSTTSAAYAEYVKAYEIYRSTIQGYREKASERVRTQHTARREKKQVNLVKATLQELNAERKKKGLEPISVRFGEMPPAAELQATNEGCAGRRVPAAPSGSYAARRLTACSAAKLCSSCAEFGKKVSQEKPTESSLRRLDEDTFTLVVNKRKARAAARKAKKAAKQKRALEAAKAAKAEDQPVRKERRLKALRLAAATRTHVQKAAASLAREVQSVKDVKQRNALMTKRVEALRAKRAEARKADTDKVQKMYLSFLVGCGVPVEHAERESKGRSKRELNELLRQGSGLRFLA